MFATLNADNMIVNVNKIVIICNGSRTKRRLMWREFLLSPVQFTTRDLGVHWVPTPPLGQTIQTKRVSTFGES
eukprot:4601094-Amphidinium_carterae.1